MEKIALLAFFLLCFTHGIGAAEDYSKMSANEVKSAFIKSVKKGSSDEVQKILQVGRGINDDDINEALMVAAQGGHTDVVRAFLQVNPTVDAIDKAFLAASQAFPAIGCCTCEDLRDHLHVIKELIKAGAHVNNVDHLGNTALMNIVTRPLYTEEQKNDRAAIVEVLLNAKINVDHGNQKGETAFIIALKGGCADVIKKLLQAKVNVNQKFTYTKNTYDDYVKITCTPLEYAAEYGYEDIVKELVRVKDKHDDDINTALVLAAKEGHTNVVRGLLGAKPKIDGINKAFIAAACSFPAPVGCGRSALRDYLNVIKELINAGAHVNHTDDSGDTALMHILNQRICTEEQKNHRAAIVDVLLKAKINVNHVNKYGETALIIAIQKHDLDAVQILLKAPKINLKHVDKDGNTSLIIAAQCVKMTYISGNDKQYNDCVNSQEIVQTLLKTPGINPHHKNKKGDTAVMLLEKYR